MTGPEDFLKAGMNAVQASQEFSARALDGFQKLTDLQMRTARDSMDEFGERIRELIEARDVQALTELTAALAQPVPEKFAAYARAVYGISSETGQALAELLRRQANESNANLVSALGSIASGAVGQSGSMDFVQQAMRAASDAYAQMNGAARDFVRQAEQAASDAGIPMPTSAAEPEDQAEPTTAGKPSARKTPPRTRRRV
ncbi:MAG: phasin family protein [Burkholderiaceae bacterium]|nr:phasin family protein [Burkholderiaceae bacterium]